MKRIRKNISKRVVEVWQVFKYNFLYLSGEVETTQLKKVRPLTSSVSDPYSSNPDPAKNLNSDPDPVPDPSYFLPLSDFFFITSFINIRFSHQKKSIKRQKVTNKLKEYYKSH